jgi:hypothetical protein
MEIPEPRPIPQLPIHFPEKLEEAAEKQRPIPQLPRKRCLDEAQKHALRKTSVTI